MAIRITCPGCETSLTLSEDKRGKKVRCRACEKVLSIPAINGKASKHAEPEEDEEEAVQDEPQLKVKPGRKNDVDDEDEESDRPAKKKKNKNKKKNKALRRCLHSLHRLLRLLQSILSRLLHFVRRRLYRTVGELVHCEFHNSFGR